MIPIDKGSAWPQGVLSELVQSRPILEGVCDRVRISRCVVRAGASWTPELYPRPSVTQMLLFLNAGGYVTTPTQAFSIFEPALFVPEFDKEPFIVHAGVQPLRCIQIVSQMNEEDCSQIKKSHMVFPRFRPFSQAWEHTMRPIDAPDSNTRAFVLIENRKLGANNMGILRSDHPGASHMDQTVLDAFDQFVIALEGADCAMCVQEEEIHLQQGDVAFIPKGTPFRVQCGPEGRIHHVWYHLNRAYDA